MNIHNSIKGYKIPRKVSIENSELNNLNIHEIKANMYADDTGGILEE